MRVDVLIYEPGVLLPKPSVIVLPEPFNYTTLNDVLKPLIGGDIEYVERVKVLFRGEPTDMFVDELGAVDLPSRGALPINEAATLIYREASRLRGEDNRDAPKIHGVAVVCLQPVWF